MPEKRELVEQIERICALYPTRTTPEYIEALTAELWARYGGMSVVEFRRFVDAVLDLAEYPPTLATFAAANAERRKRVRDLARNACGDLLEPIPEKWNWRPVSPSGVSEGTR